MKISRRAFVKKSLLASASATLGGTALISACTRSSEGPSAPAVHTTKTLNWKMVTTWPKNFPGVGTGANHLAQLITQMSGERIKVKVFGANELVPAMGVFDAVSRGTAELGHCVPYYWKGKHEAAQFFGAVPFGLNSLEMMGWLNHGGGQELWDELYAPFGLKSFPAGDTSVQMGGWFNKEIKTIADFKGLKMRMPGLGAEVLRRLGSTVVTIPGGEVFQALQTGAIDATEWIGPYNDLAFGLHQAAKYYYWPGWHEPSAVIECMVNRQKYEELPKDLKQVVAHASRSAYQHMLSEFMTRNASALLTLTKKHGVQMRKFPDAVLKKLGETSQQVVAETAAKDAMTKKVFESYNRFRGDQKTWNHISTEGYSLARALTFGS